MPVRNGKDYIVEAINSVISQDFHKFELIIADDGSVDFDYGSLVLLDPRIRTLRLEGVGVSAARNAAMAVSKGDFIAFLDADDVYFPGKLTCQVRYLASHPDVGAVFARYKRWWPQPDGRHAPAESLWKDCAGLSDVDPERSGDLYARLLKGLLIGTNTIMLRREVYEAVGGFELGLPVGEDVLYWLAISRRFKIDALDGEVAFYRGHGASATTRVLDENFGGLVLEEARRRWGLSGSSGEAISARDFDGLLASQAFQHGYNHFASGDACIAARSFRAAWAHGRHNLRTLAYVFLSTLRCAGMQVFARPRALT